MRTLRKIVLNMVKKPNKIFKFQKENLKLASVNGLVVMLEELR